MRRLAIFGATATIARAAALPFARDGDSFFLVGRNPEKLAQAATELRAAGAVGVTTRVADLDHCTLHAALVAEADAVLGGCDVVLIAQAAGGNPAHIDHDYTAAEPVIRTTLLSVISLAIAAANLLRQRRIGTLAVISSIVGDRGRPGNIIYSASKGGLNVFLEGLRSQLRREGVQVLTIKPGFVATPLLAAMPPAGGSMARLLTAQPDRVGRDIYRAIIRQRTVLYTPWFWRPVMAVIRFLPDVVYRRLTC